MSFETWLREAVILLVDDDPGINEVIPRMLNAEGFQHVGHRLCPRQAQARAVAFVERWIARLKKPGLLSTRPKAYKQRLTSAERTNTTPRGGSWRGLLPSHYHQ